MTDRWTSTRAAYDTVAEDYARLLCGVEVEGDLDRAMLDDFARRVRGRGPVLDAGCGPGRITRYLSDRGVDIAGIDLSAEMVRAARNRHPGLAFSVGSLDRIDLATGSLAGVLAWYSIINTPPGVLPAVVAELMRLPAPGGWLLIGCQSGSGARHIARAYGHDLDLTAYLYAAEYLAELIAGLGGSVRARLTRSPEHTEKYAQAFVLARV